MHILWEILLVGGCRSEKRICCMRCVPVNECHDSYGWQFTSPHGVALETAAKPNLDTRKTWSRPRWERRRKTRCERQRETRCESWRQNWRETCRKNWRWEFRQLHRRTSEKWSRHGFARFGSCMMHNLYDAVTVLECIINGKLWNLAQGIYHTDK